MAMHSNWNPWHGCVKCSEGCQHCYVYYLDSGQIKQVTCGGENYGGSRPCDFEWVKTLREDCVSRDITFCFMETGTNFIKDGRLHKIRSKQMQNSQAVLSGMTYRGKPMHFALKDSDGRPIPEEDRYVPHFAEKCKECSFQILCNGCFNCGACEGWQTQEKDAQGRKEGGMLHQMPKI